MDKPNLGVILFKGYLVDEITYKRNENYAGQEVDIDLGLEYNIKFSEDKQTMNARLKLTIFEDYIENNYPFGMDLTLTGRFEINPDENSDLEKYHANALAILYPYARAIVSTYTASANINPLQLPTINVNKYLQDATLEIE